MLNLNENETEKKRKRKIKRSPIEKMSSKNKYVEVVRINVLKHSFILSTQYEIVDFAPRTQESSTSRVIFACSFCTLWHDATQHFCERIALYPTKSCILDLSTILHCVNVYMELKWNILIHYKKKEEKTSWLDLNAANTPNENENERKMYWNGRCFRMN